MGQIDEADYGLLLDELVTEFPEFEIKKKRDSTLMKVLNVLLRIITFNQMKTFLNGFITTIGTTVYVPDSWDSRSDVSKWVTLSHERVHMVQAKKYGRFLFSFLYLLCLPCLFAFYRTKFEKEGYETSLKCMVQAFGPGSVLDPNYREKIISHFTTAKYFWMWVRRSDIEEWYDNAVATILEEEGFEPDAS